MHLNLFSIAGIVLASTCLFLVLVLLVYGKTRLHRIWACFNAVVGLWGVGAFLIGQTQNPKMALILWKFAHLGIIFIPVFVFHLSYVLCNIRKTYLLVAVYAQGIFFLLLNIINHLFVSDVRLVFSSFYYVVPGVFYAPFFCVWLLIVLYAHYVLFLFYRKSSGNTRNQILYLFVGTLLGFLGGATNFLPVFYLDIYPVGNFTIPLYCLIVSYAILKYRLMDIRLFISRAVAFLISYSILLVVPFFFAYRMYPVLYPFAGIHWWLVPAMLLVFFSTCSPVAFEQMRKGMENTLLADQKRYQKLLLQASSGMVREHDIHRLSKLVVYLVKRIVKIEFAAIFLYDKEQRVYKLKAMRDGVGFPSQVKFLFEHHFITYLKSKKEPVLYDEVPMYVRNSLHMPFPTSLVIPLLIEDNLLGFVILGNKLNREPYSDDDMNVFEILAHQAAMAIESCLFFEEFRFAQERLFSAEKLASIGGMADGVAHQIKNRLNHFSVASGEMQYEIKDFIEKNPQVVDQSPELKKSLDYLSEIARSLVENVKRTDGVVKGILNYARVEEKETFFSYFSLQEVLTLSLELLRIKHEIVQFPLEADIASCDTLYGVKAQIMESVYNILDNGYEAVQEKRRALSEEEKITFQPRITFKATQNEHCYHIETSDNGIGIKEEDKHKIFAPFFTTKSSYKSGTGIGMYVVKRIVEENHKGKITFDSTYTQGTRFVIDLPKK
ncbi:MAG: ATP-binding protein [Candidatus Omnitrophota bacterium]